MTAAYPPSAMDTTLAYLLIGGLLLATGLSARWVERLPVTRAMVYLAAGFVIGPSLLGWFHFNPLEQAPLLERLTEGAVLLSLFTAGLKMPPPVSLARWRVPVLLATASMAVTIGLMAAFGVWALGLSLGGAVLLAAILAPTDPVLATEVQVRQPGDRDRLRFGLTCEAGMNDGSAYPFVMLGLALVGAEAGGVDWTRWLLVDTLWATVGGIAIGLAAGHGLGRLLRRLRRTGGGLLEDFVGLGLIAVVYGICLAVSAGGFLGVFFAAVALRRSEGASRADLAPRATDASLHFKEQLERLSELLLIVLVGGTLFLDSWSWRALATALFLFTVARPLAVLVTLLGSRTPPRIRGLAGWFGVRGIGSLYYLMFVIGAGVGEPLALELIHVTLIVVTLSILVHGVSVKPALRRFWRREPPSQRPAPAAGTPGSGR